MPHGDPDELSATLRTSRRPQRAASKPPSVVGPYRIERFLGRGGMGVVYLATDTRLGRSVAIKAMAPGMVGEEEHRLRFEREARVLAGINHAHVATIYDLERDDEALYLVLEYLDGEGLDERIARGPLAIDEACAVGAQVAAGLAAAHARGIVHRDLKPANIRSTSAGAWKVLDFGLARHVASDQLELTGEGPIGTPLYMSPEQVLGCDLDESADLWALGCVVYQCLTGERTFTGRTAGELEHAILTAAPDWARLPAGMPESVARLLVSCLDKEPERRWRSADEARRVLLGESEAGSGSPRRPLPPSPVPGLPRQLTSFVGRAAERAHASALLRDSPMVTLTGAGGCGKTRLAIMIVADQRGSERFPDGAVYVDLAPLASGPLVPRAVSTALGLREVPGMDAADQVAGALREKRSLLVLDNCEHVLRETARFVVRLLDECPGIGVLATSREALGVRGESVLAVPPLPLPEPQDDHDVEALLRCDSVRLFVERARAARSGFALTREHAALVATLCRRLDGISAPRPEFPQHVATGDSRWAMSVDRSSVPTGDSRWAVSDD